MRRFISQYVDSMFPPPWPTFCNLALSPPQSNLKPINHVVIFSQLLTLLYFFFYVIICFFFFHFTFPFATSFGKSSTSWTHARMLPLLFELPVSWFMNTHTTRRKLHCSTLSVLFPQATARMRHRKSARGRWGRCKSSIIYGWNLIRGRGLDGQSVYWQTDRSPIWCNFTITLSPEKQRKTKEENTKETIVSFSISLPCC